MARQAWASLTWLRFVEVHCRVMIFELSIIMESCADDQIGRWSDGLCLCVKSNYLSINRKKRANDPKGQEDIDNIYDQAKKLIWCNIAFFHMGYDGWYSEWSANYITWDPPPPPPPALCKNIDVYIYIYIDGSKRCWINPRILSTTWLALPPLVFKNYTTNLAMDRDIWRWSYADIGDVAPGLIATSAAKIMSRDHLQYYWESKSSRPNRAYEKHLLLSGERNSYSPRRCCTDQAISSEASQYDRLGDKWRGCCDVCVDV
jgi:hypothetical protein